jgi:hypothetical protein
MHRSDSFFRLMSAGLPLHWVKRIVAPRLAIGFDLGQQG